MSVNFNPNITFPSSNYNPKPVEKPACEGALCALSCGGSEPETVANAEFDNSKLRISTAVKGWMDSNIWYTIQEDGSALLQTAWCPGKDVKAGTYSEIYQEAKERSAKNGGSLTNEDALELVEKIKQTDVITKNGM